MALSEIKQISIREFLKNMGIHHQKDYGYYGMYFCPFRKDQNASFKVDYRPFGERHCKFRTEFLFFSPGQYFL